MYFFFFEKQAKKTFFFAKRGVFIEFGMSFRNECEKIRKDS